MKKIFKTLLIAATYLAIGSIAYILLMMLFAWMASWWWFFIVVVGIGGISSIIGLGQLMGVVGIFFADNWLGKGLAALITIYLLYFSINAVWTTDFFAENAKEMTVKIIATITFLGIYLTWGIMAIIQPNTK
jgi:hypothetical protein